MDTTLRYSSFDNRILAGVESDSHAHYFACNNCHVKGSWLECAHTHTLAFSDPGQPTFFKLGCW